jgi:predicted transcriptional regulator
MKSCEQKEAVRLRQKGISMGEIASTLGVAKSSVSLWVRDIKLTDSQRARLNKNGHSIAAIEKRRTARLIQTKIRRDEWKEQAMLEASLLSKNTLWCIGVSLYWGEGGKTQMARISNSDPALIRTMMNFFRNCCDVSEEKFRGHIHAFAHSDVKQIERYWSDITHIPEHRLFKTYIKQSSASLDKRHTLPYGTFQIYVQDTSFFYRMLGWLEYIKQQYD